MKEYIPFKGTGFTDEADLEQGIRVVSVPESIIADWKECDWLIDQMVRILPADKVLLISAVKGRYSIPVQTFPIAAMDPNFHGVGLAADLLEAIRKVTTGNEISSESTEYHTFFDRIGLASFEYPEPAKIIILSSASD